MVNAWPIRASCGHLSWLSLLWIWPINLFMDVFISLSIPPSLFPWDCCQWCVGSSVPLPFLIFLSLPSLSWGKIMLTLSFLTGHCMGATVTLMTDLFMNASFHSLIRLSHSVSSVLPSMSSYHVSKAQGSIYARHVDNLEGLVCPKMKV